MEAAGTQDSGSPLRVIKGNSFPQAAPNGKGVNLLKTVSMSLAFISRTK